MGGMRGVGQKCFEVGESSGKEREGGMDWEGRGAGVCSDALAREALHCKKEGVRWQEEK